MTALRKFDQNTRVDVATSLFDGAETGLFPSGSGPQAVGDLMAGEAVSLFPSGSGPVMGGAMTAGEGTRLFPSGS
ncbi:DUF6749 family protein [Pseudodonghicola xiamenensis]|uniref:Uncharacterized protein n=1 Tax=Pseudodonghicola xiamenensis TaxID=337702 RepID=A0A8J3H4L7_9RHOB|nr:DUF6749 family protein [Pseudodonghicola xiamenensis]GHG80032.1 hypothetical protein GCM10010961_02730 [Pseudodonghicola xiamenensis]